VETPVPFYIGQRAAYDPDFFLVANLQHNTQQQHNELKDTTTTMMTPRPEGKGLNQTW